MLETLPERHYRDRLKSLGELASLPEAARTTLTWHDFQDLAMLCFELSVAGRDLFESEFRSIFKKAETIDWLRERRNIIEELTDDFVRLAESVKASAVQAWHAAGRPAGKDVASLLDSAIKTVCEARRSVLERWPVGSLAESAEADAAIAQGETIDIDEAFAQIAGTDVATWRRSFQEYPERVQ